MTQEKRGFWDSIGKFFRGRKWEIPEGADFCDVCGRIVAKDDIHLVIPFGGREAILHVCEDCSELPPSEWKNRFGYYRKQKGS